MLQVNDESEDEEEQQQDDKFNQQEVDPNFDAQHRESELSSSNNGL